MKTRNRSKTRILFVDDDPAILEVLELTLDSMSEEWKMAFASSGEEALSRMARQPFDVIVSDMRMSGMDGAQLLDEVWQRYPSTVRLILSGYSDVQSGMRCVGTTHQFLLKPFSVAELKTTLQRICKLRNRVRNDKILALVARRRALPTVPAVYIRILKALQNPNCSAELIGEIIEQDPGLTGKILQLVNSAFFGVANEVSNACEAVLLLGVGTIRSLALSLQLFSIFNPKAGEGFSVEQILDHSLRVGLLARRIAKFEEGDEKLMEQAFTAGLMHDVGKLMLTESLSETYLKLIWKAQQQRRPLVEMEKEALHATHAEVGAYLLDLWGLPIPLVEAVALHHEPRDLSEMVFSPLTAVHVSNVIEHETGVEDQAGLKNQLDLTYLNNIGLADRVKHWRAELCALDWGAGVPRKSGALVLH
ncbi:MAG: response regulator [Candidatus Omnitrophica bacterium]|nr:response regulator [Candidatus Omnitrophota bacterium]